jgi:hypothetical protein
MHLNDAVIVAFSMVNTFRVIAYVPQILRIMRDGTGAHAVAISTWMLFLISHLTTVAYAVVVAEDLRMAAIFMANAVCCAAIVGLAQWKRIQTAP